MFPFTDSQIAYDGDWSVEPYPKVGQTHTVGGCIVNVSYVYHVQAVWLYASNNVTNISSSTSEASYNRETRPLLVTEYRTTNKSVLRVKLVWAKTTSWVWAFGTSAAVFLETPPMQFYKGRSPA
jgi:hypothetical protein